MQAKLIGWFGCLGSPETWIAWVVVVLWWCCGSVGCVVRGEVCDGGWIGGWGWMGLGWVMCMAPGMVMMVM